MSPKTKMPAEWIEIDLFNPGPQERQGRRLKNFKLEWLKRRSMRKLTFWGKKKRNKEWELWRVLTSSQLDSGNDRPELNRGTRPIAKKEKTRHKNSHHFGNKEGGSCSNKTKPAQVKEDSARENRGDGCRRNKQRKSQSHPILLRWQKK